MKLFLTTLLICLVISNIAVVGTDTWDSYSTIKRIWVLASIPILISGALYFMKEYFNSKPNQQ